MIIFTTDTLHHRYFISYLAEKGFVPKCIFLEETSVTPKFPIGPIFEEEQNKFENKKWKNTKKLNSFNLYKTPNINSLLDKIKIYNNEQLVVFGTRKIDDNILNNFKIPPINIHRGDSRRYRGLDSDLWAIYHNDYDSIGVTIHEVVPQLDKGKIIYFRKMKIIKNMLCSHIRYYTTVIASELVVKILKQNYIIKKDGGNGRYYSFMPLDLKKIVEKKFNLYCAEI